MGLRGQRQGQRVGEVSLGEHDVFGAEGEGVNHEGHKPSGLVASTSVHLGLPSQPSSSARGRDERQGREWLTSGIFFSSW